MGSTWRMPCLQDFFEYIIREPGSVYARDYAVTNHDVMNSRARVLHSPTMFDADEVRFSDR